MISMKRRNNHLSDVSFKTVSIAKNSWCEASAMMRRIMSCCRNSLDSSEVSLPCLSFMMNLEGAVKIDVEHAGQARMICAVLILNIDKYQYNETQQLTEAIFD